MDFQIYKGKIESVRAAKSGLTGLDTAKISPETMKALREAYEELSDYSYFWGYEKDPIRTVFAEICYRHCLSELLAEVVSKHDGSEIVKVRLIPKLIELENINFEDDNQDYYDACSKSEEEKELMKANNLLEFLCGLYLAMKELDDEIYSSASGLIYSKILKYSESEKIERSTVATVMYRFFMERRHVECEEIFEKCGKWDYSSEAILNAVYHYYRTQKDINELEKFVKEKCSQDDYAYFSSFRIQFDKAGGVAEYIGKLYIMLKNMYCDESSVFDNLTGKVSEGVLDINLFKRPDRWCGNFEERESFIEICGDLIKFTAILERPLEALDFIEEKFDESSDRIPLYLDVLRTLDKNRHEKLTAEIFEKTKTAYEDLKERRNSHYYLADIAKELISKGEREKASYYLSDLKENIMNKVPVNFAGFNLVKLLNLYRSTEDYKNADDILEKLYHLKDIVTQEGIFTHLCSEIMRYHVIEGDYSEAYSFLKSLKHGRAVSIVGELITILTENGMPKKAQNLIEEYYCDFDYLEEFYEQIEKICEAYSVQKKAGAEMIEKLLEWSVTASEEIIGSLEPDREEDENGESDYDYYAEERDELLLKLKRKYLEAATEEQENGYREVENLLSEILGEFL
jgi:hypothetical protein